jgi:predicted TIM-barrel fold metal-dependent hydrolase
MKYACTLLLATALTACTTPKIRQEDILTETDQKKISKEPVVDIHMHSFNALYLPLKNIVRGKRDILPPLSWLLTDGLADSISESLVRGARKRQGDTSFDLSEEEKLLQEHIDKYVDDYSKTHAADEMPDSAEQLSFREALMVESLLKGFSPSHGITAPPDDTIRHFLRCMVRKDTDLFKTMLVDHHAEDSIQLALSLMMDLAPVYDQKPKPGTLWDFESQQIPRMRNQVTASQGRMAYFVAWNPFRDHWCGDSNASQGNALRIVQNAVKQHGAMGVKVYPPSGYRPYGNKIPRKPFAPFNKDARDQYKARYEGITAADLDTRCAELFNWCVKDDVPVLAHCGSGEFEARKGYGKHHAHPAHWSELLKSSPEMRHLRLCLGHAGGESFWIGGRKEADWGMCVYQLCTSYPNVYCEFGIHGEIVDAKHRDAFVRQMTALIQKSRQTPGGIDFASKVMYGSDWFMPMSGVGGRENYLVAFQDAALRIDRNLGANMSFYRDFMYRNALRFLDAKKRSNDTRLSPALRLNLKHLVSTASKAN